MTDHRDRAAQLREDLENIREQLEEFQAAERPPTKAIAALIKMRIDLGRELHEVLTSDTFSSDPTEGMNEEQYKDWLGERAKGMADEHLLVFAEVYARRYNVKIGWEAAG